jgi:DNA-directed RNA polymerase subunit omega
MLYPSIKQLMKTVSSRYLLVNVTANRAREIAEFAERNDVELEEKPVKMAISEIADGKLVGRLKQEVQL